MKSIDDVPLYPTKCYVLNGITYVPHYVHEGMYAAPGYMEGKFVRSGEPIDELTLKLGDAKQVTCMLWHRSWVHGPEPDKRKPAL